MPLVEMILALGSRMSTQCDGQKVVERFHKAVMAKYTHDFEFHDLGRLFDQYYTAVPVKDRDITDETVFVDVVHLYDPGNQIVARHLAALLR